MLDDLLYPEYRDIQLREPVFILAPPRTGSTSLHRALTSDESRFYAPVTAELFFPFITVMRALHYVHGRPALRRRVVVVDVAQPPRWHACASTPVPARR